MNKLSSITFEGLYKKVIELHLRGETVKALEEIDRLLTDIGGDEDNHDYFAICEAEKWNLILHMISRAELQEPAEKLAPVRRWIEVISELNSLSETLAEIGYGSYGIDLCVISRKIKDNPPPELRKLLTTSAEQSAVPPGR